MGQRNLAGEHPAVQRSHINVGADDTLNPLANARAQPKWWLQVGHEFLMPGQTPDGTPRTMR